MASPYSTGGGGTHFEAKVAASYLAAILCDAPARGLLGQSALSIRTQAESQGEPLDDIVVEGHLSDGRSTKLSLQVKADVAFTANNTEWPKVVRAAWDTFSKSDFDLEWHRTGIAIATYNAKVDKFYQSVLTWATHSKDASDFYSRISQSDFSHSEKSAFVDAIRTIVTSHTGASPDDERLWLFLRTFVILHFDFNLEDRSRDAAAVLDRIFGIAAAMVAAPQELRSDRRICGLQIWKKPVTILRTGHLSNAWRI